jgi:tRNA/tmRNA/rRNA uracil-C5-methylase (TrmA/RlmC/RlmD family)
VKKKWSPQNELSTLLILDPPRSGLKNLQDWLNEFRPRFVAYVSCDPHTLVRDLMGIENYKVTELHLIDFFPGTFHYESMVFLEEK